MIFKGTITFFVDFRGEGEKRRVIATTKITREWKDELETIKGVKTLDIEFEKANFPKEKLLQLKDNTCYTMEVEEGFLTLSRYKKDGADNYTFPLILHVSKGRLTKATPVDVEKRKKALEEAQARKGSKETANDSPMGISEDLPF